MTFTSQWFSQLKHSYNTGAQAVNGLHSQILKQSFYHCQNEHNAYCNQLDFYGNSWISCFYIVRIAVKCPLSISTVKGQGTIFAIVLKTMKLGLVTQPTSDTKEGQGHKMVWVAREPKDHLIPSPVSQQWPAKGPRTSNPQRWEVILGHEEWKIWSHWRC